MGLLEIKNTKTDTPNETNHERRVSRIEKFSLP